MYKFYLYPHVAVYAFLFCILCNTVRTIMQQILVFFSEIVPYHKYQFVGLRTGVNQIKAVKE